MSGASTICGRMAYGLMASCLLLAGCRHRVKAVLPVASTTPIPVEKAPEPNTPAVMAQVPLTPAPLTPVKLPEKKPKKKPKKIIVPEQPPLQVASATPVPAPPPSAVIGALTVGGDEAPEKRRQVVGMIAELDKRLAALPVGVQEQEKESLTRVRNFQWEAKAALDSGDVEGAATLATKAKLLLDDLVK